MTQRQRILAISDIDLFNLPKEDWIINEITDNYFMKIIHKANQLGLNGLKIKEIISFKEDFLPNGRTYIDFICEDKKDDATTTGD